MRNGTNSRPLMTRTSKESGCEERSPWDVAVNLEGNAEQWGETCSGSSAHRPASFQRPSEIAGACLRSPFRAGEQPRRIRRSLGFRVLGGLQKLGCQ